jgi:hypothetical protein
MVPEQVHTSTSQGMRAYWSLVKAVKTIRTTSCVPVRELEFGLTSGLPGIIILCASYYPGLQYRDYRKGQERAQEGKQHLSRVTTRDAMKCFGWCAVVVKSRSGTTILVLHIGRIPPHNDNYNNNTSTGRTRRTGERNKEQTSKSYYKKSGNEREDGHIE